MKINIANHLITRRCNLSCEYCKIATSQTDLLRPVEYPKNGFYNKNEKSGEWWIKLIDRLHKHNSEMFHVIYGGEPLLRLETLTKIIEFMHKKDINYTIVSNCTGSEVRDNLQSLIKSVGKLKGFSASVDPYFTEEEDESESTDEKYKTFCGYSTLKWLIRNDLVEDPVAEIVCDNKTIYNLERTVKILSDAEIWSSINVLDIAKNNYYDFSTILSEEYAVHQSEEVRAIFDRLISNDDLMIHMKDYLLNELYNSLPTNVDCGIEKDIHNITIDSDGKLRLCLRIRGMMTQQHNALELINKNGYFADKFEDIYESIKDDKFTLCKKCAWACPLMSKLNDNYKVINH